MLVVVTTASRESNAAGSEPAGRSERYILTRRRRVSDQTAPKSPIIETGTGGTGGGSIDGAVTRGWSQPGEEGVIINAPVDCVDSVAWMEWRGTINAVSLN
ncbi:hypothetical protein E2C01_099447 [Portunus trituberculatus]|uniref:Uncharacterized protein n=1 Tax=Portunus trituberculatus TaxID=210409 RepID=A0A5B7K5I0_PORTR|nr:hypothetical protein [Portunus trituberculatus]